MQLQLIKVKHSRAANSIKITFPSHILIDPRQPLYVTQHPDLKGDIAFYDTNPTPNPGGKVTHIEAQITNVETACTRTPASMIHDNITEETRIIIKGRHTFDIRKPLYLTQESNQ